jgi:hypothetical protein
MLEAFKKLLTDDTILDKYTMSQDVKEALKKNIAMRLTPQPVKVDCGSSEAGEGERVLRQMGTRSSGAERAERAGRKIWLPEREL